MKKFKIKIIIYLYIIKDKKFFIKIVYLYLQYLLFTFYKLLLIF